MRRGKVGYMYDQRAVILFGANVLHKIRYLFVVQHFFHLINIYNSYQTNRVDMATSALKQGVECPTIERVVYTAKSTMVYPEGSLLSSACYRSVC